MVVLVTLVELELVLVELELVLLVELELLLDVELVLELLVELVDVVLPGGHLATSRHTRKLFSKKNLVTYAG